MDLTVLKKSIGYVSLCAAFTLFSASASADTLELNDGTRLVGKIITTTPEGYIIEIRVSPTILDEQKVLKKDVKSVSKETLEERAFLEVFQLLPVPDFSRDEEYDRRALTAKKFISDFPASLKLKEVSGVLKTIQTEAAVIASGGKKVDGSLFTAELYQANAFEIDAMELSARIWRLASRGDWLTTLRYFSEFRANFSSTRQYKDLLPLVGKVLHAYNNELSELISTLPARQEKQAADFKRMPERDRNEAEMSVTQDKEQFKARYTAELAAKSDWPSIHPLDKTSLEFSKQAVAKYKVLVELPVTEEIDGGKIYRDSFKALKATTEQPVAQKILAEISKSTLPKQYVKLLMEVSQATLRAAALVKTPAPEQAEKPAKPPADLPSTAANSFKKQTAPKPVPDTPVTPAQAK